MAKLHNLARMTTATAGTGTITLGAAVSGYLTFAQAGVVDGDVVDYAIKDGNNSEIGIGTYISSGTTLTRSVTNSTNNNAAINLSGTAEVFISPRAQTLVDAISLTSGTLNDARLSANVPLKNSPNTFTKEVRVSSANLIADSGDVWSFRSGGTTGIIFLNSSGTKYLYNDSIRYHLVGQGLSVSSGAGDISAKNTAKAFVNAGVLGGVLTSYNVSSISKTGVGQFTITFTTPFSSANYAALVTCSGNATQNGAAQYGAKTASQLSVAFLVAGSASVFDPNEWSIATFGDQ